LGFPITMKGANLPFERFVRFNAERGEYGPGDVAKLTAERVALAKKFIPHRFERHRPGGPSLEIRGNPLPGGGFITTYTDITERHRTETALHEQERLIATVLDRLPQFLTVKDGKGRYLAVNRAFAKFWGQEPQAFAGKRPTELPFIHPAYAREIDKSDREVLQNGRPVDIINRQVSPFGQRIIQRVIKVPVLDDSGTVTGVVAMIEDVTARVDAEEKLRANERLLQ
jgi:PAS domain S-box-containing protein